ncbi:MAG: hypothetical protein GKR91_13485 [Pseudomonadales bacterium]|nr:hypothetical protein [Pseudomonadales bacterium]
MRDRESHKDKYSVYSRVHLGEFKNQLRDDASRAMVSWPARTGILILVVASLITYIAQSQLDNPYALYTLFPYFPAIALVVFYPFITLLISSIEKYSPFAMDLLLILVMLGFCLTLHLIFIGATSPEILEENFLLLQGQIAFTLAIVTAFAFHARFLTNLIRNLLFTILLSVILFSINERFFLLNVLLIPEGFFLGTMLNWMFHDGTRTRFYFKSTDADTRQHLYNQLSKLVYPHQLERIKLGDELENTMPLKEGKAIINVFDVQKSSEIRHERTQEFFMGVFQSFLQICMKGYEHNPLRSRAFRLKETGDGFISSVGYPFLPVDSRSLADSAVATALDMFEAFNLEVQKFNYSRPIKGAMGLAYNSVQGTFQSGGIRSYDLFGEALIQASKYEEIRKQAHIWELLTEKAKEQGLEYFNIIIAQEVVYNSLSPSYRDLFVEIDFADPGIAESNFQMMYDNDAKYLYYHLLE